MDQVTPKQREALSEDQAAFYEENGYLVLEGHLGAGMVAAIRDEIARLEAQAAGMTESDDKIDREDSHTPENPRVRRIKLPHTQSPLFNDLLRSDTILAPVRDLIGPDLRLHTTKLNMKLAGFGAAIEWHQDFAFYPHTNDDVLAVAVIIDDMKLENGPLMVYPGSHRGPILDHHENGVFAGGINMRDAGLDIADAVPLTGPAGSISIHHARIIHGSAQNTSDIPRRLMFFEIMAADAFPVMGAMTRFEGIESYDELMLCGTPTISPRLADVPVRIPQPQPDRNRSIYEIQKNLGRSGFDAG
ncbi:MAG: phytanoyl-CoA dioxygenase family protein [Pseudomonadota bacterium]|nr:phytanoyl-CoA dioxygenase family protein [Pseudomonadota bacterium]